MTKPVVGQKASRTLLVTDDLAHRYADLTGDLNPVHFDDEFARHTRFGERIVPGGLTTGLISALVALDLPGPGSVFTSQHYAFPNPAYIGDILTATVEVKSVKPDEPVAELAVHVTRSDGATVLEGSAWVYVVQPGATV